MKTRSMIGMSLASFLTGLLLVAAACGDDKPAATADSEPSQGDESPARRAKRRVDDAHEDFKEAVKPAANWVDEKTGEVVNEGGRAVDKIAGDDDDDDDE